MDQDFKCQPQISSQSPHLYMKVNLCLDKTLEEWTPVQFKYIVMDAMKETLGQVGASASIDILKFWSHGAAILRIPSKLSENVWVALTLYRKTPSGIPCVFRVEKATPFLAALAFNVNDNQKQN